MNFLESMQMAGKTLLSNKLRSALTMLGIVIGNASVIAMIGIGEGGQRFVAKQLESLGPNVLFVIPGNRASQRISRDVPKTLVFEDAQAIANQVPTVAAVTGELNSRQVVTYGNQNSNVNIVGTTPAFLTVRDFETATGRFFTDVDMKRNNQVVVLGADLAERLFGNSNPQGQQLRIKNASFQVIGVLESKGSNLGVNYDEAALIPLITMANRIVGRTSPYGLELTYIVVSAKNAESVDAAQFQITNLLRLRHKITGEDDFTINTQKDALQTVGQITGALTIMLAAIAGISLFVGGIGIMNIMLVSVTERTQEIGLRKAIGATEQDILLQFIIEAVIVSVFGGVVGTAVGVSGILLVAVVTPLEAAISASAIATAVGVSGGIGLFFGVVPARRAAQLDPIVALRSA
ncbi:ABC transporter permease [Nodularia spumigena CS-584]|jgi:putative ABC transport system permease protein|uniref:ABC transporter permease n=1 Tax=Nodularia spumigena UHCC 0060 TaxID=3110300 RepID=A0ABU5UQ69_NODSP|nr:ABC transporter permease [Nodularia spumigena]AHJ31175.1 Cell division protein FtsX [Nodularia spumigena CCY9414]MDB9381095.1 ABC transporter permease [Nodularia spumigena CS-584]MEA5524291.1 ABC transporter permease [Nodularia spumigena UHCC 0143]MEA5556814.1 ABC transporter permease [Nodularia spumigena CH309]MEA5607255.1 ABC transporter permease [Nodularia spumigena UHCC 0060]